MKHILLFGAGKSATVLINYLSNLVQAKNWTLTVADGNSDLLQQKVIVNQFVQTVTINLEEQTVRQALIEKSDLVISMMPPQLHFLIALDCLQFNKHLLTASYIDEKIKTVEKKIEEKGLLFLYEMGLDPGIDHMSAMKIVDKIHEQKAILTSFKSHCGGLVAPESDDNPWHYKITWNPKNIILAGKSGAIYKEKNQIVHLPYELLFNNKNLIKTSNKETYAYYANRDSLSYIELYNLQSAANFLRTTLRHPNFCIGWQKIIELQLTNEVKIYETNGMSIESFFIEHCKKNKLDSWLNKLEDFTNNTNLLDEVKDEESVFLNQLHYLDLNSKKPINKGICSAADVLQFILEEKLKLGTSDKDLVVMIHEIEYSLNQIKFKTTSTLHVTGKDSNETAMAKTVGLPLGIAAKLILENKINLAGLQIPTSAIIYNPVLQELTEHGIIFNEITETC